LRQARRDRLFGRDMFLDDAAQREVADGPV